MKKKKKLIIALFVKTNKFNLVLKISAGSKNNSRVSILENLELQGFYIGIQKNRPKGRTQSSMVVVDSKVYMFGGLSSLGLDDMWRYDLKGKKSFKII